MDKDIEENNDLGDAGKKALQSERDARKAADNARAVAEQALAEAQTKLQEATKAVEIIEAIYESARNGKTVSLKGKIQSLKNK